MALSNREAYLQLIEGQPDVGGRFRQLQRIGINGGEGGFSLVFTAVDTSDGESVVIKVYNPDRAGELYRVESFRREAQLLSSLQGQPDIVRIVTSAAQFAIQLATPQGISVTQTFDYYAIERATGDARAKVATGRWSALDLLTAFRAMCRAVQRIHRQGIAHRDLKPENFFVMGDGGLRLGDFGAAALVDGSVPRLLSSYAHVEIGDPRYAPPEITAALNDVDAEVSLKADVFALGASLFELFTGQVLGLQIHNPLFYQVARAISAMPVSQRRVEFEQRIEQLVALQPLPSITGYGAAIPGAVAGRVDRLYQAMCHFDYRKRTCDFNRIFHEVTGCEIILRNDEAYRRWKAQRQARRKQGRS